MILTAALVVLGTLVVGVLAALGATRLPSLRLQLAVFGLVAVALPLSAVLATGVVMFDSGHDVVILAIACAAGLAALAGAWLLSRTVVAGLERVGRASSAMAAGDLRLELRWRGPSSSTGWPATSTGWPRDSRSSSTLVTSSWRGRAMTCERRSPR